MVRTLEYLKERFQLGDKPTEQDFADLIDTLAALASTGGGIPAGAVPFGKADGSRGADPAQLAYYEAIHAFAVGLQCVANAEGSFAAGRRAQATHTGAAALGTGAKTRRAGEFVFSGGPAVTDGDSQTVIIDAPISAATNGRATVFVAPGETLICEWRYAGNGTGASGKVLLRNYSGALIVKPNGSDRWEGMADMTIVANLQTGGIDFIPALESGAAPVGNLSITAASFQAQ